MAESVDALPQTRSQEKKWSKEIKSRLARWVQDEVLTIIESAWAATKWSGRTRVEGANIYVEYEPLAAGTGYVRPAVIRRPPSTYFVRRVAFVGRSVSPAIGTMWPAWVKLVTPMVEDGLLLDEAESFDALIDRCRLIEQQVNSARRSNK